LEEDSIPFEIQIPKEVNRSCRVAHS
jgi:hypothetical protein